MIASASGVITEGHCSKAKIPYGAVPQTFSAYCPTLSPGWWMPGAAGRDQKKSQTMEEVGNLKLSQFSLSIPIGKLCFPYQVHLEVYHEAFNFLRGGFNVVNRIKFRKIDSR
jgi:hypothetical protein